MSTVASILPASSDSVECQTADERLTSVSPALSIDLIHDVIASAYDPYVVCLSDFAPLNGKGLALYIYATEALRGRLDEAGWQSSDQFGVSNIISKDDRVRIVCSTSADRRVGIEDGSGPAVRTRGTGTLKMAGYEASKTLPIPGLEDWVDVTVEDVPELDGLWFYYLLMHIDPSRNEIRSELSRPKFNDKGEVTGWFDRIIVPPFSIIDEPIVDTTEAPAPEIEVMRRTA